MDHDELAATKLKLDEEIKKSSRYEAALRAIVESKRIARELEVGAGLAFAGAVRIAKKHCRINKRGHIPCK